MDSRQFQINRLPAIIEEAQLFNQQNFSHFLAKCFLGLLCIFLVLGFIFKTITEKIIYNFFITNVPELTDTNLAIKNVRINLFQGKLSFNELTISDLSDLQDLQANSKMLYVKKLAIDIGVVSLLKGNLVLQNLLFDQPIINIGHPKFAEIHPFSPEISAKKDTNKQSASIYKYIAPFKIEKIVFVKGKIVKESSLKTDNVLFIENLNCSIENIGKNINKLPVKFKLTGSLPAPATGKFELIGDFSSFIDKVTLIGEIKATDITLPYFNYFLDNDANFNIKNGTLQVHSNIRCQNNWLVSSNLITLENLHISFNEGMEVNQKIFGLPVKIVTDFFKADKISFNLPISGDIRDPQFGFSTSISQILLKAFQGKFKDSTAKSLSNKMGRKIGEKIDKLFRQIFL